MLGPDAWIARGSDATSRHRRLVIVFLRGAVDGLNVVVPHHDSDYYENRPSIALPRFGERAVIDLDGYFGLNPALDSLMPMWKEGTLAFVHACGSSDPTRSHFDAQDFMESGTPGLKSTADGWLNRAMQRAPGPEGAFRAVALQPTLPRMLVGDAPAVAMSSLSQFKLPGGTGGTSAFDALYAEAVNTALRTTGLETFEALREAGSAKLAQLPPDHGA